MSNQQTEAGKDYAEELFKRLQDELSIQVDDHTWKYEDGSYVLRV